jgi:hypothetical protein
MDAVRNIPDWFAFTPLDICKTLRRRGYRHLRTTVGGGRRCGGAIECERKGDDGSFFDRRPGFDLLAQLMEDST